MWLGNDYGGEESLGCQGKLGAAVEKGSGGEVVTAAVEFTIISCWKLAVGVEEEEEEAVEESAVKLVAIGTVAVAVDGVLVETAA